MKVGAPDDEHERDADRTARRIIGEPGPPVARSAPARTSRASAVRGEDLAPEGSSLPAALRAFFEPRFNRDLSGVRLHTSPDASAWNDRLGARAFTYKQHVWLRDGVPPAPDFLLAHELAHVVQHGQGDTVRRSAVEVPAAAPGSPDEAVPIEATAASPFALAGTTEVPETCPKPETVPCAAALEAPGALIATFVFPVNSATLSAAQLRDANAAAASWHTAGASALVRVDGFASAEGQCESNWGLSCRRAQAVAAALEATSDGSPGVDNGHIEVVAHGESDEGGGALALNRRATIGLPSVPPTPPAPAPPACPLPVSLGSARGCHAGADFGHHDFPRISTRSELRLAAWAAARPFSVGPFRRFVSNFECEVEMSSVLLALAGSEGAAAFARFAAGTGGTVTHGRSSTLGGRALTSASFLATVRSVQREIERQLAMQAATGALDPCSLSVTPPPTSFGVSDGLPLKAVIGGTQGEELFATGFSGSAALRTYAIDLRFLICDDFGVDENDLYAPGLFAFWVLQHERSPSKYAPFVNELDLPISVSGTF